MIVGEVMRVTVPPQRYKPCSIGWRAFVRERGGSRRPTNAEKLTGHRSDLVRAESSVERAGASGGQCGHRLELVALPDRHTPGTPGLGRSRGSIVGAARGPRAGDGRTEKSVNIMKQRQ